MLKDIHPDIPTKVAEVGCERLIYVLTKVDAEGHGPHCRIALWQLDRDIGHALELLTQICIFL